MSDDLRELLAETTADAIEQSRDAIADGDVDVVLRHVHAIKGAFAIVHEHVIVSICVDLEEDGGAGCADALAPSLAHAVNARLDKEADAWWRRIACGQRVKSTGRRVVHRTGQSRVCRLCDPVAMIRISNRVDMNY
ncbi:HPt (histidine-containing phosphotransfer) domain-containing protein [Burkholderia ambifaria]|nr:Hpt domain-containing protein [Burkholderia ambifaria]MDR6504171.1 HPt (histidine-containing phosphotransfer) domain-containing protein [Burkholderia ambifaria]